MKFGKGKSDSTKKIKRSSGGGRLIIDIGNQNTKIIEVVRNKDSVTVKNVFKVDTSRYVANRDIINIGNLVTDLVEFLQENKVKSKKISVMFTTRTLEYKFETIPEMSKKELKEYIKNAYEITFTNKTEKTHCIDYATYGEVAIDTQGVSTSLMLACIPKNQVSGIIKEFKKSGYKVDEVDTHLSSLIYLYSVLGFDYEHETKMILDLGYHSSHIIVMHMGVPIAIREFTGMNKIIESVKKEIEMPTTMINELIEQVGLDKDSMPENAYDTFDSLGIEEFLYFEELERAIEMHILDDIQKSVGYYSQTHGLNAKKLFVVGGGSVMKGLRESIEKFVGSEVEMLEVVSSVTTEEYTLVNDSSIVIDGSFGPCVGLAVKGAL